jgi:hypothetical protein
VHGAQAHLERADLGELGVQLDGQLGRVAGLLLDDGGDVR